jgi:L,D-transpeptidase YcbB
MGVVAVLLAVLAALPMGSGAPPPPTAPVGERILEILRSGRDEDLRWPALADVRPDLDSLYARAGAGPLWIAAGRPTPQAVALVAALQQVADRGLDPEDYDARWLDAALAGLGLGLPSPATEGLARFDLALSVATARLVRALANGRVAPTSLHPQLLLAGSLVDRVTLVEGLRTAPDPVALLDQLEPRDPEYRALEDALRRYRRLAVDPRLAPLTGLPRLLRPGDVWAGASRLRVLLVALGDLPEGEAAADSVYDRPLVEAVRRFQRRHGLTDDGVIGTMTAGRLAQPLGERVRQLELALERWRWLPRVLPSRYIEVNLAAFRLTAVDAERAPPDDRLEMAVIVGEAEDHQTPSFSALLRRVVFRPWWEVPLSIMRTEVRPAALADSGYLGRERMELWQGKDTIPASADNVARIGHGVRVRQRPGPLNPLGAVKFLLPSRYDVHLHDTPAKRLFGAARRDFSHGCIRVADAVGLARFVLRDQPEWTDQRMADAMLADESTEVEVLLPIAVYVLYRTAVASGSGEVRFYPDLYGYDGALAERLHEPFSPRGG